MKQCIKCLINKSFNDFYVQLRKKDGYSSWCINCHITATNKATKLRQQRKDINYPSSKSCARCKEDLPFTAFHKRKGATLGLLSYCIKCVKETRIHHDKRINHDISYIKTCIECTETLLASSFGFNSYTKDSLNAKCLICKKIKSGKFDLTKSEYIERLTIQNNSCYICNFEFTNENGPVIDHNHSTGKIRKFLCQMCNQGLGLFKDNVASLEKAAKYINEHF